jgi:superfamily II RNA helicase
MTNYKRNSRSYGKRSFKKRQGSIPKGFFERPRLDPHLKHTFKQIGVPEATPFRPDPFQQEALDKISGFDLLVSAPTGAGKTWIASQAISQFLSRGLRVWYASPLKALSNSLYQEFCHEFGHNKCGILTGERKENTGAPVIVGTTEILRNQLYDTMHEGISIQSDLVILDEAHYLSDPDRGVVWEEVLIYLPSRVRLLLLSATISNAEELCSWLQENRGTQPQVVSAAERPVPLNMLFLFPDGLIAPLSGRKGLTTRIKKFVASPRGQGRRSSAKLHFGNIIKCMREFDLLPAIFFLKSRADCDQALRSCPPAERHHGIGSRLKRDVKTFVSEYPHLEEHRQLGSLLNSMVASHHAGQLPYWKILIEKMMNRGYLEAIFSTSTVAAGVNFPARTVALIQSDRYNGHEFTDLTATELHQMIGRAGRRGKDNIGFALVIPGLHQDPQLIYTLKDSPPEPLVSQIHINFSMALNLLLSHTPREVKDLLDRSFASFQQRKSGATVQRRWDKMIDVLNKMIPQGRCDRGDPYEILENIRKRSELKKEARELSRDIRDERLLNSYEEYLKPGRLFLHKGKGVYALFHTYRDQGRLICAAHNIQKALRARKRKIRLRKVPFDKIKVLYDYRLNLAEDHSLGELQNIFDGIKVDDLEVINIHTTEEDGEGGVQENIQKRLKELPCEDCEHLKDCHTAKNRELRRLLNDFRSLANQMAGMGEGLWISFRRHVRFLKESGFVDEMDRLTPDGIWASKLRLDHPLLIAGAIRNNGFDGLPPEVMAGCIAPFVLDRVQDLELNIEGHLDLKGMEEAFDRILDSIEDIRKLKITRGFENPKILFWPAAALFLWAKGVPWEQLLQIVPVDEGDIASMVMRTADHLRQVANLEETHHELVSRAKKAIELILREPVLIS